MIEYSYFTKKNKSIELANGTEVDLPEYVFKAMSNYRYQKKMEIIEKRCYECDRWFKVATFDGKNFRQSHKEEEIHFHGGTYATRCKKCTESYVLKQKAKIKDNYRKEMIDEGHHLGSEETGVLTNKFCISKENEKYLRYLAAYDNVDIEGYLDSIVTGLRTRNSIEIKYNEEIKKFW